MENKYKDGQYVFVKNSWARNKLIAEIPPMHETLDYLQKNAYGEVMSWSEKDQKLIPVICMHGGSMWLCRECAKKLIGRQKIEEQFDKRFTDYPGGIYLGDKPARKEDILSFIKQIIK